MNLVTGVDFVFLPTRDWEAATEFYGTVLGLPAPLITESSPAASSTVHVDDDEAARAELESRGVSFNEDTLDSGDCHMAFFEDPDGNALVPHHRYAPRDG